MRTAQTEPHTERDWTIDDASCATLTKREYMAAHIAAAMCTHWFAGDRAEPSHEDVADEAAAVADALLARLNDDGDTDAELF